MKYDLSGQVDGPALLLLHGAAAKDTFCHLTAPLGRQWRVVVPHLPGGGAAAAQSYDPEAVTLQLLALLDELGSGPVAVMGHSLGAQLALRLVCAAPGRFLGAALLSPWVCPTRRSIDLYCAAAGVMAPLFHCAPLVRWQGRYWGYTPAQQAAMARDSAQLTAAQYRSFFANTTRLADLPAYPGLDLPLLAVCGEKEMREMRDSVAALAAQNPHCRSLVLPGLGHDYPLRAPEVTLAAVDKFLSELR